MGMSSCFYTPLCSRIAPRTALQAGAWMGGCVSGRMGQVDGCKEGAYRTVAPGPAAGMPLLSGPSPSLLTSPSSQPQQSSRPQVACTEPSDNYLHLRHSLTTQPYTMPQTMPRCPCCEADGSDPPSDPTPHRTCRQCQAAHAVPGGRQRPCARRGGGAGGPLLVPHVRGVFGGMT